MLKAIAGNLFRLSIGFTNISYLSDTKRSALPQQLLARTVRRHALRESVNSTKIMNDFFLNPTNLLSTLAFIVSVSAIVFPIRYSARMERRNTFFKIYEYWNADYMQALRLRFWRIIKENRSDDSKIDLLKLYEKNYNDYHVFERIYDLLNDMANLYKMNHIDRKLVHDFMLSFIRMYGNALDEHFYKRDTIDTFLIKMSPNYYYSITELRNKLCKNDLVVHTDYKNISSGTNA